MAGADHQRQILTLPWSRVDSLGLGLGNSIENVAVYQRPIQDFVISIVIEEFGFVGANGVFVACLFPYFQGYPGGNSCWEILLIP